MIKQVLEKLANVQEKYPVIIVLLMLIVSLFFGYYAFRIESDSSFDVMFSEDTETIKLKNLMSNEFGSTDSVFILVNVDEELNDITMLQDIRHPDVLKAIKTLSGSLEAETSVSSAVSLVTIFDLVYGRLPTTLEESKSMINNLPEEIKKSYLSSVLSDDFSATAIFVSIDVENKPGSLIKTEELIREKIEQTPFPIGVSAKLTGLPILINRILFFIINDNITTIFLAILGVFIVLWIYFKSYKIALLSIIPVSLTLLWLAGTLHLLDVRITVMIASVGAMIVGMSVDYAIHLTHAFHKKVKEGETDVTKTAVVSIGAALFASVATTFAGFSAMMLGSTPNSVTQGLSLSIGVVYAFIITLILLPALMVLQRKFIYTKLDETIFKIRGRKESSKKGIIDSFLKKLAEFQVKRPIFILGIVGIITLLIIPGFSMVYMDTDGKNWMPENDDVVDTMNLVGTKFGGTDSVNVLFLIEGDELDSINDLRDPRVIRPMASLDKVLEGIKWIDIVESPTNDIRSFNDGRIPQDYENIKKIIEENPSINSNFNDDYSIAKTSVRANGFDPWQFYDLKNEVESIPFPKEISIVYQGAAPRDVELEQMMGSDTMKTALIGFVLVIVIASLFYLSIISGLLAFIPIVFSIMWTVGTMGYIDLPFTILTTGMLAILMGMGIDFSIHLIHSTKLAMEKYNSVEKAVPEAMMDTGQALSITTITTVIGFMALSFATLVNTMRLGWTLAIGIFATFFACILIVPAVLTLKYKRRNEK
ncbi:RND family transporter [Nanoarchaeota archaeon]